MTTDPFDDLVASLDPPMLVVTAAADGEPAGCLVGFHSQCSIEPVRYVVWLSTLNRTFHVATRASHVAVHLLGAGQHDLAERFGGTTGDDVDKFAGCAWSAGPGGAPLLDACPDRMVLRRTALVEASGDHVGFVGEPLEPRSAPAAALLRLRDVGDIHAGHPADEAG